MNNSDTKDLTLKEFVERLSTKKEVEGVVIIGSVHDGNVNPFSDYDIVIVLSDSPIPFHVGLGQVDHTLTDYIFVKKELIDQIVNRTESIDASSWTGRMIRWLQAGKIHFDRSGLLASAQKKVKAHNLIQPFNESQLYNVWFGLTYNLKQTTRMMKSQDPIYQMSIDLRLLYTVSEVFFGYFTIRKLLWNGEKKAFRYLEEHDREYLELFNKFFASSDRTNKLELYKQLVQLTLEPLKDKWPETDTIFNFDIEGERFNTELIKKADFFWQHLTNKAI